MSNTADNVEQEGWTKAFDDKSAASFANTFVNEIVLEAVVLVRPVEGIELVKRVIAAAGSIYEALTFTQKATNGPRTYLEWEAQAFSGQKFFGVTALVKNDTGKIVRVAIHHRPLGAALRFSAELEKRLQGQVDSSYFYTAR
jgi:hypothetical protein